MANRDCIINETASKNILARIAEIVEPNSRPAGGYLQQPTRPEIGPQALYSATGHNVAMGDGPDQVWFKDEQSAWRANLEWVLFHLEQFDEPSRHWVLAATAFKYGLPFEVLMGGML